MAMACEASAPLGGVTSLSSPLGCCSTTAGVWLGAMSSLCSEWGGCSVLRRAERPQLVRPPVGHASAECAWLTGPPAGLQGCSGAVKRVLDKMEGVQSVDIDLAAQKVVVKGNVTPQVWAGGGPGRSGRVGGAATAVDLCGAATVICRPARFPAALPWLHSDGCFRARGTHRCCLVAASPGSPLRAAPAPCWETTSSPCLVLAAGGAGDGCKDGQEDRVLAVAGHA